MAGNKGENLKLKTGNNRHAGQHITAEKMDHRMSNSKNGDAVF
mgnify:CR=1 FL=1